MYKKVFNVLCIILVLFFATACNIEEAVRGDGNEDANIIYEDKFIEDFEDDDALKNIVAEQVFSIYERHINDYPDYGYSDWRIIDVELVYQYEQLEGLDLDVYRVGFELFSQEPENIIFAGGMYMTEDNWVCPTYPNSTYFIFENDASTLEYKYIVSIMVNDCNPGGEMFTEDIVRIIKSKEL